MGLGILTCSGVALASWAVRLSLDQLIAESDRVVLAEVSSSPASAWAPDHRRIQTTTSFKVVEAWSGTGPAAFELVQPGGAVGRWGQKIAGYASFEEGERVLMFLRETPAGLRVVGMTQGVFDLETGIEGDTLRQRLDGLRFTNAEAQPLVLRREVVLQAIKRLGDRGARQ